MRAVTFLGPRSASVDEVPVPDPGRGEVLVAVERVGLCGTDVELFEGTMAYLHTGRSRYPLRPGHEWAGTVAALGDGVGPEWEGERVTGDTMLGDGTCDRCQRGRQHLCEQRAELGLHGRDGALAEYVVVPVGGLHRLPDTVDMTKGALVEPGGNAMRAFLAANVRPGDPLLVMGPGTIGLLVALFAQAAGAEVHILGLPGPELAFARSLGFTSVWTREELPARPFQAVVDASTAAGLPALAGELVEPGGRVVWIGLAGEPSLVDTRALALKDVTAVGVLSASPALAATVEAFAAGAFDPAPLVSATVGLEEVAAVLSGARPAGAGAGPKVHVDPRL
jgi:threonine dehydrogenase-like Zn-dependent dehydrogenase